MRAGLIIVLIIAAMGLACHKQKAVQRELIWAGAIPEFDAKITQTLTTAQLNANYPNRFSPTSGVMYEVTLDSSHVSLIIWDITGKPIDTLVNGWQPKGLYNVRWTLRGNYNSGVYFYRLTVDSLSETKKLVLWGDEFNAGSQDSHFTVKISQIIDTLPMNGEIFRPDTAYHPDAPHPFSPPGDIFFRYQVKDISRVRLLVSDITDSIVDTVMNIKQLTGCYRAAMRPQAVQSGIYFYKLSIGDSTFIEKFVIMR